MQVPTYNIEGARIATRAILHTQPRACIKLPSSCTVRSLLFDYGFNYGLELIINGLNGFGQVL